MWARIQDKMERLLNLHDTYDTKTDFSAFYLNREKSGINSEIKFSIKKQSFPYRAGSDKCDLCRYWKDNDYERKGLPNKWEKRTSIEM